MNMQRRQQTETMEGRLPSDLTPAEARLASTSASLDGRRGWLLPKAPPAEGDLKIWTGESGLSRVRLALGNKYPEHRAMCHPGLTAPPLRGLNFCIPTLERRWESFPKGVRSGIANSGTPSRIVLSQEPAFFRVGSLLIFVAEPPTILQCGLLTLLDSTQGDLRLVGCCPRGTPWPSGPSDTKLFSDGGVLSFLELNLRFQSS